ncbi:MAG TPA: hypothetical protein VGK80_06255 [Rhodanobacteraceae bacterium]
MKAALAETSSGGISNLQFVQRKESWVAESSGRFYKIVRKSDDPLQDLRDPECIGTALREYTDMRFLHGLSERACRPEGIKQACIVYPLLSGPDMRTVLMDATARESHRACLHDAIAMLARLHRPDGKSATLPVKDYQRDTFLPPDRDSLERMERRERTLVITGFEARNFRFDRDAAAWFFFDPHHLWLGFPEEDFARFVISLLMIKGRLRGFRPWTDFDRFALLSSYESLAPARLDRSLLNYFLHEQLAKRRFHAMQAARRMRLPVRALGRHYTDLYYRGLRRSLGSQEF